MSATIGVRSATAPNSSRSSGIPYSWAIASRCRTPLVEPPVAATLAIPFSSALRVTIDDGRTSRRTRAITRSPGARAGARGVLALVQLVERHLPGPIGADRLEDGHDRGVPDALHHARVDRPAV